MRCEYNSAHDDAPSRKSLRAKLRLAFLQSRSELLQIKSQCKEFVKQLRMQRTQPRQRYKFPHCNPRPDVAGAVRNNPYTNPFSPAPIFSFRYRVDYGSVCIEGSLLGTGRNLENKASDAEMSLNLFEVGAPGELKIAFALLGFFFLV